MLIYLDACLPDYFRGYSGPVLCVAVDGNTTIGELRAGLEADLDVLWDDERMTDERWAALEAEIETLEVSCADDEPVFPGLDPWSDDDDYDDHASVCAYFGVDFGGE